MFFFCQSLILILITLVIDDVEEAQLIHSLGGGDHAQPIPELLLLEELLGQILQIPTREGNVRDDLDLPVARLADADIIAQVPGAALDFNAVVQEFLEGAEIEDLVGNGLRAVDRVLVRNLPGLRARLALHTSLLRGTTSLHHKRERGNP